MTIKEIARLAGVSTSTVSKVVSGSTDSISKETRQRVMAVVKQYHYTPYAKARANHKIRSFQIGLLLRKSDVNPILLERVVSQARKRGYGAITCISENGEDERKNIALLLEQNVGGLILHNPFQFGLGGQPQDLGVPHLLLDTPGAGSSVCLDYARIGSIAASRLADHKHQRIALLVGEHSPAAELLASGMEQCLFDRGLEHKPGVAVMGCAEAEYLTQFFLDHTGFICYGPHAVNSLCKYAQGNRYSIPRDLSVIFISGGSPIPHPYPKLTVLPLPYEPLAKYAVDRLIASIEGLDEPDAPQLAYELGGGDSLDVPFTARHKKIVVVGSLHLDTFMNIRQFPAPDQAVSADSMAAFPGGKGANQAVGCAKLGAEVCLIGKLGKDYEGTQVLNALRGFHINVSGVGIDPDQMTGRAYIHIEGNGESSIVISEGANDALSPRDIDEHQALFQNASFCLVQTEIPFDTVERVVAAALEAGVRVVLKPSAVSSISGCVLKGTHILLPNEQELNTLLPGAQPLEEKANYFLEQGVDCVIVTQAAHGCTLVCENGATHFPAANFKAVDTTGAADAFAAALTVYLAEGHDLPVAIRYANYAAGFSITRQGVIASLVDKEMLEFYLSDKEKNGE